MFIDIKQDRNLLYITIYIYTEFEWLIRHLTENKNYATPTKDKDVNDEET